jgi:hypothetical protein
MRRISILIVLFLALLTSCSETVGSSEASSAYELEGLAMSDESMPVTRQLKTSPAPPSEQKIIQNARLEFETPNVSITHARILDLVEDFDGFVQNDNSGKNPGRLFRQMNVRIPASSFDAFIDSVSVGIRYFDQKEVYRRDVTEEFIDLEARLKTKSELEQRYRQLLSKAQNVKEILEIERELSKIREDIESQQGRLEYLKSQVAMSSLNISFYETVADTGVTVSYGRKMINAFKGGWNGISVFFIGLIYLWPLFLLILIGLLILRSYLKRKKRTTSTSS